MDFPREDVLAQLERILASPGFASADRASRFLRFVVERTVAGEGDQLKEYVIGREVFDRGDEYDPRVDSIVRVEAGRLRSKLDEYYAGTGQRDPILIQLRKGSYVPVFGPVGGETFVTVAKTSERTVTRSRLGRNLALFAAGLAVVALGAWRAGIWKRPEPPPPDQTIAVLPFAHYSTDQAEQLLAARVTDGITAELARLGTLGVVSHTSALQFADARPPLREIAKTLGAQFILEGKVRDEAGRITIQVVLIDASVDHKVWVDDAAGSTSEIPAMQRQLAQAASAAVLKRSR